MRLWKKAALGAAGLVLVTVAAHESHVPAHQGVSAVQEIADHPMPPLFDQAAMAPYSAQVDRQGAEATRLMQSWWRTHDKRPEDKHFVTWLDHKLPTPPNISSRQAEAKQLEGLTSTRTASGQKAARWLQRYGGRDIWLYYEHTQAAQLSHSQQSRRHRELTHLLGMARTTANSLNKHLQQPAPFLIDPALKQRQNPSTATVCPCSYPAGADATGAAGRSFLSFLYPQRATLYKHMTDELGFGQVYLANHLPSDVDAGSLLGDMVGEYFLVTREGAPLHQVSAALAATG
jgi:hypothetical protein